MPSPCPHCGTSMCVELGGKVARHPSHDTCQLSNRSFVVQRKGEKDRRVTWFEYCSKYASTAHPGAVEITHSDTDAPPSAPAPLLKTPSAGPVLLK